MRWRRDRPAGRRPLPARQQPGPGPLPPMRRYQAAREVPAPEDSETLGIADFLLRLAEVVLGGGASTADVEASVIAAGAALGLPQVEVDITFTALTVTVPREHGRPPVTQVRVVRSRSADYARLAAAHNLVVDLVEGRLDRPGAVARLEAVETQHRPYPRWVVTVAWGLLAAAVTQLLGGTPLVALVAFATTALVDRLGRLLARRSWPDFFLNVVGAFSATLVAVGLTAAQAPVNPALVVAGGIIVLLSGVAFVATVHDAITGFLVTAAGRSVEVLLLTAGIISGVAAGLLVARRLGVLMGVLPPADVAVEDLLVRVLAAGVGSAAFALAYQAPRRLLPSAFVIGGAAYAASAAMYLVLDERAAASAVAAVLVGLLAHVVAPWQKAPPLVLVVPAIVPLLPGLTIYRGMLQISDGSTAQGLFTLLQAATTALALAAGVILGEILGQPVRRGLDRVSAEDGYGTGPAGTREES